MQRILEISPSCRARIAGALYVLSVAAAVIAEFFARGRFGVAGVFIPVLGYAAVTLLLYEILKLVQRSTALVAAACGLAGLTLEALRWQPGHVNAAMVLHGVFCLLIGYLMMRSSFLPRLFGALMIFAGFLWLLDLSPALAKQMSPYNTALGLLGEALPMLWLLGMGIHVEPRRAPAGAVQECQ
jgi:Domain of unknown function (DUF4386)